MSTARAARTRVTASRTRRSGDSANTIHHTIRHTPFEEIAELAIQRRSRFWKPGTLRVARGHLKGCILPFFCGSAIGSVTRADVEAWFAGLSHIPGTANRAAPVLSAIMQEAEDAGIRPPGSNPAKGLRLYRLPKRDRVLSRGELGRLGSALQEGRHGEPHRTALIRLLALTGCRVGELLDLQWRDYRGGHLHLRDSKTGPKVVFLSSPAREVLDGVSSPRPGPVFPPAGGGRSRIAMGRFWRRLRHSAGLHDVRLHDLRHTYASFAIRGGESLNLVGVLLGHAKPETTMRYAHLDDATMRAAAAQVCGAISMAEEIAG